MKTTIEERALWMRVGRVMGQVEESLTKLHGKKIWLQYVKPLDQLRLLQWETWSEQYRVPVGWIATVLVQHWTEVNKSRRKKSETTLGTRIPALVGKVSKAVLLQKLAEQFPDGQAVRAWQAKEQARQFRLLVGEEYREKVPARLRPPMGNKKLAAAARYNPLQHWLDDYRSWLEKGNKLNRSVQKRLSRRRYRGNPWIR